MAKSNAMKQVTLKEVADRAGCSVGVVSVVLNGRPSTIRVSDNLRQKIHKVVKEIGYVANYHAQSLHLKNSRTLGLVLSDEAHRRLANGFWAKYVAGVDHACRGFEYDLLFIGPSNGQNELDRAILQARQSRIDALVVLGHTYSEEQRAKLDEINFPVVYLEETHPTAHPGILLNERPATLAALYLLVSNGHKELVYITAEPEKGESHSNRRVRLLRELCAEVGLKFKEVHFDEDLLVLKHDHLEVPVRGNYDAVLEWLKDNECPTAMAFFNDLVAIGGMNAIIRSGYRIPEDVSVFSFDDVRAVLAVPPLSVVSLELAELGSRAVRLAMKMIEQPEEIRNLKGSRETVLARFVNRESIGLARH